MSRTRVQMVAAVSCVLLLTSCSQDWRVPALEAQVKVLETKVTKMEAEVEGLKQKVSLNKMLKDWEGIAYMTPATEGSSLIKSDLGSLTVSLRNIQPYANGSKITLQ